MKLKFLFILKLFTFALLAQEKEVLETFREEKNYYSYDSDFLNPEFHRDRRAALRALMPDSTVAIVFASPERNRANDVYFEYHQDPNFYYLSGLTEPNSLLVIFKEKQNVAGDSTNEILFVQERDPDTELWNGRRLGQKGSAQNLGFETVKLNADFKDFDLRDYALKRSYFIAPYALEELNDYNPNNLSAMYAHFMEINPEPSIVAEDHLQKMLAKLRQKKKPEELELLKKAIEITCKAQNELMRRIDTSMREYQTEAIIEYVFKSEGAEYTGFPSIQGSGENSCILHYTSNRRPLKNGGLLVSDVGAEYHGYTADVTRTIPPSGKFSPEEALIYELVLKAQTNGIEAAQAGNSFWSPHTAAQKTIAEGLLELGIIENKSDVRNYFMHGTSHYLGLDVHDAGLYQNLEAGEVITVEPGIYIAENSKCDPKWWNIGVRIEDDILITEEGPVNLSEKSPRTIREIESLMQNKKP